MAPLAALVLSLLYFFLIPAFTFAESALSAAPQSYPSALDWKLREIALAKGQNFISFPVLPPDHTIENVLPAEVIGKIRIILGYDNRLKHWRYWMPNHMALNTLHSFEFGSGYWLLMEDNATLDASTWEGPDSTMIRLYPGWNLIGWLSAEGTPLENALKPVDGTWDFALNWQNGRWSFKSAIPSADHIATQPLTVFQQGHAYWIHMRGETDWAPPPNAGPSGWIGGCSMQDGFGVILATTDGGQTWVRQGAPGIIPDVDITDIKAIDAKHAWAVGLKENGYGVILRTTDGGTQWVRRGTAGDIPNADLYGIGAVDTIRAWVVGQNGTILLTRDGGITWTPQESHTTANLYAVAALDKKNAWVIGDTDGGYAIILHTRNGGRTWVRQGTQETVKTFGLIDISAADRWTAWAVGADQTILRTTDGGNNWVVQMTARPQMGPHVNGVCAFDGKNAWASVDNDYFYVTTQGGDPWITVKTPPDKVTHGYYLISVTGMHMDMIWTVGTAFSWNIPLGNIIFTSDGGQNWVEQTPPVNTRFRRVSFVGTPK